MANNYFTANRSVTSKDNIHILAPSLWPLPSTNLVSAWRNVTSLVIVRHPMARLASVYYNKFVKKRHKPEWRAYTDIIIKEYRHKGEEDDDEEEGNNFHGNEYEEVDKITPNEFIKYVFSFKCSFY